MIHAHDKYKNIQDPENKIGVDEPVFLLRAKDRLAPDVIRLWADRVLDSGNKELATDIYKHVLAMEEWQKTNGCKMPD